jgi:hypothetical protein
MADATPPDPESAAVLQRLEELQREVKRLREQLEAVHESHRLIVKPDRRRSAAQYNLPGRRSTDPEMH